MQDPAPPPSRQIIWHLSKSSDDLTLSPDSRSKSIRLRNGEYPGTGSAENRGFGTAFSERVSERRSVADDRQVRDRRNRVDKAVSRDDRQAVSAIAAGHTWGTGRGTRHRDGRAKDHAVETEREPYANGVVDQRGIDFAPHIMQDDRGDDGGCRQAGLWGWMSH